VTVAVFVNPEIPANGTVIKPPSAISNRLPDCVTMNLTLLSSCQTEFVPVIVTVLLLVPALLPTKVKLMLESINLPPLVIVN